MCIDGEGTRGKSYRSALTVCILRLTNTINLLGIINRDAKEEAQSSLVTRFPEMYSHQKPKYIIDATFPSFSNFNFTLHVCNSDDKYRKLIRHFPPFFQIVV